MILIITVIVAILLGAAGDGLYDDGKKFWGKLLKDLEVLVLLAFPLVLSYYWLREMRIDIVGAYFYFFGGYVCVRFALFSYMYNLSRGLTFDFIGSTGWFDRFISKFGAPWHGWLFAKVIFLAAGISMLTRAI